VDNVKTLMIHKFVKYNSDNVSLSLHDLNGDVEMWCFEFSEGYSFHQPKEAVNDEVLDEFDIDGSDDKDAVNISFSPSSDTDTGMCLDDALDIIRGRGVDVNNHFESEFVEDYEFGYRIDATFD